MDKMHSKRIDKPYYLPMAQAIEDVYSKLFSKNPDKIIDVGCSVGELLRHFSVKWKKGVDIDPDAGKMVLGRGMLFQQVDFEKNRDWKFGIKYDCIVSLEVAEHIENWRNYLKYVDECSHLNSLLIFSAARPHQPGTHHVNCQRPRWWRRRLGFRGWLFMEEETNLLKSTWQNIPDLPHCYWKNLQIFKKVNEKVVVDLDDKDNSELS